MGVKWAGHGVDHLSVSSTEIKKAATLLVLLYAFMVQTGTSLPFAFYSFVIKLIPQDWALVTT